MKIRSSAGLVAGLVVAALLPSTALAGPTVTVRVEGANATLLERTRVTLPDTAPSGQPCTDPSSAGAALDGATGGNWDRQAFASTILGESHTFVNNDYWAEWVDHGAGYRFGGGLCADILDQGDELLMLVDKSDTNFLPTVFPLDIEGVPATVRAGSPLTVTVVEYRLPNGAPSEGVRTPVSGATVRAGSTTAPTGSDGRATLTLTTRGPISIKASRAGNAPSAAERVTVGDVSSAPAAPDRTAPIATIDGIRNGQTFSRRKAPRKLRGSVTEDPSGLWAVKIRLTRKLGNKCWYFSGSKERFLKRRCGKKHAFKVGDRAEWSYLLPSRLPRGRYVLDTYALDNAFNRSTTTRVRFRVR